MNAYERYCELRDKLGYKDADVVKKTGVTKSTFSSWKTGRYVPKEEKMQKIAEALGTTVEYIRYGAKGQESPVQDSEASAPEVGEASGYYLDPETAKAAQEVFDDPNLRILFDAARNSRPDDILMAADMLKRFKETNPDG